MKNIQRYILIFSLIAVAAFLLTGTPSAYGAKASNPKFTVVIDAGHGGKDPGAQDNGVSEKDINLGVALKLGEFIKKNLKDVRVIYTRDKDVYLTLQQRAEKANKNGANLFISLHVNSLATDNPRRISMSGSSVHVLGQSKESKNADVVKRENSVIKFEKGYNENYQGFDPDSDESYIIFEMMHKRQQERSLDMAREVQKQLKSVAGRNDRGVTQEPFWVLWATSMPAVLVEMDYICNPNSAKYLASNIGQNKIAKALFNAVRTYYTQELALARQPKPEPEPVEEEPMDDAGTYVSDGYAIIGTPIAPERKASAGTSSTSTRRATGSKRRSAAARAFSSDNVRVQNEVNVRTYSEPSSISHSSKPQTSVQTTRMPEPQKEKKAKKQGKTGKVNKNRQHTAKATVTPTTSKPKKTAKADKPARTERAEKTSTKTVNTTKSDKAQKGTSTSYKKTTNPSAKVVQTKASTKTTTASVAHKSKKAHLNHNN